MSLFCTRQFFSIKVIFNSLDYLQRFVLKIKSRAQRELTLEYRDNAHFIFSKNVH